MASNITYLLGAGASCKCIPVVSNFAKGFTEMVKALEKLDLGSSKGSDNVEYTVSRANFIKSLEWLFNQSMRHASIDTYAKKLYLTDPLGLDALKNTLNTFFIIRQTIYPLDTRYDLFLAALLSYNGDKKLILPNNIKILSWNYDSQIEYSYRNFLVGPDVSNSIDEIFNPTKFKEKEFNLIKLNGTAGNFYNEAQEIQRTYIPPAYNFIPAIHSMREQGAIMAGLDYFSNYNSNPRPSTLTFAWENDMVSILARQNAITVANRTQVLVVIGYSFPTFNRQIDRQIISALSSSCKYIYVQTLRKDFEGIKLRIKALGGGTIEVLPIFDKREFFIPFEFD